MWFYFRVDVMETRKEETVKKKRKIKACLSTSVRMRRVCSEGQECSSLSAKITRRVKKGGMSEGETAARARQNQGTGLLKSRRGTPLVSPPNGTNTERSTCLLDPDET